MVCEDPLATSGPVLPQAGGVVPSLGQLSSECTITDTPDKDKMSVTSESDSNGPVGTESHTSDLTLLGDKAEEISKDTPRGPSKRRKIDDQKPSNSLGPASKSLEIPEIKDAGTTGKDKPFTVISIEPLGEPVNKVKGITGASKSN